MPNSARGVDEVERGPVLIFESIPDRVVVVDRNRVRDVQFPCEALHAGFIVLEAKLRRVHADCDEPRLAILGGPGTNIRQRAKPIDAGEGPELDKYDFASESSGSQRGRVQPPIREAQRVELTVDQSTTKQTRIIERRV